MKFEWRKSDGYGAKEAALSCYVEGEYVGRVEPTPMPMAWHAFNENDVRLGWSFEQVGARLLVEGHAERKARKLAELAG